MTTFEKSVKAFLRELTDLKAAPTRSPSEMVMKTRTITIYPVIQGYISSNTYQTMPTKAGVAKITLDEPGFATVALKTPEGERRFLQRLRTDDSGNREFVCWLQWGSPDDAAELAGSGTKTIPQEIEVTATCDFTLTQYQTENWTA